MSKQAAVVSGGDFRITLRVVFKADGGGGTSLVSSLDEYNEVMHNFGHLNYAIFTFEGQPLSEVKARELLWIFDEEKQLRDQRLKYEVLETSKKVG